MKTVLFLAALTFGFNASAMTMAEAKGAFQLLSTKQNRTKQESQLLKLAIMRMAGAWAVVD